KLSSTWYHLLAPSPTHSSRVSAFAHAGANQDDGVLFRLRRKISLAPPYDVLGVSTHFQVHLSSLAVSGAIGRVIPNDVTHIDVIQDTCIDLVGLFRLLQEICPAAGVISNAYQSQLQSAPHRTVHAQARA